MANGTKIEQESSNSDLALNYTQSPNVVECCEIRDAPPSHAFIPEGPSLSHNDVEGCQEAFRQPSIIQLTTTSSFLLVPNASNGSIHNVRTQFSIQALKNCLESCLREENDDIDIDQYLDAYREICKLLDNLGTVIRTHIGRDIKLKIEIMRGHKEGPNGAFYQSLNKMITFEKIKKIHKKNPDENGSRTILILHRSLNFIIEFLRSLNTLKVDQGVGGIGRDAYNRTLAPFHPWAYRNIARIALTTLGKKGQLVANVCALKRFHDGSMTLRQMQDMVDCVVNIATEIYSRCQAIYEKNNFLNLS